MVVSASQVQPKIALVCSGLEHIPRGFERFTRSLFEALSPHADITLFKGSGVRAPREVIVPCLRRDRQLPVLRSSRPYYWEQVTFAAAMLPRLVRERFDIVHYSDANIGNVLHTLRSRARLKFKLLFSNGGPIHPSHVRPGIFIQQVSPVHLQTARAWGVPDDRLFLVPYGVDLSQFARPRTDRLRSELGIPVSSKVILSVAALNSSHKRIDYLIREVANLGQDWFLLAAGARDAETPALESLAAELLPGRHHFATVPWTRIPEFFASADVFVLPSVTEGFGMVLLEALAAAVPVIAHADPHFEWITGDPRCHVDMTAQGALSAALRGFLNHPVSSRSESDVHVRFSWPALIPQYISMYDTIASSITL